MIQQTPIGYFVLAPGAAGYQGPYPTETAARAVLSNATARYDRAQSGSPARPAAKPEKPEPIAPRVVKAAGSGPPRRERRARSIAARRKHRQAVQASRRKSARALPAESLARAGLATVERVDGAGA